MSLVSAQMHRRTRRPGLVDPNVRGMPIGNISTDTDNADPASLSHDNNGNALYSAVVANTGANSSSPTYDGDSMTKEFDLESPDTWVSYLLNPSDGVNTWSENFSYSIDYAAVVVSIKGVSSIGNTNSASGSDNNRTVSVNTTSGSVLVATVGWTFAESVTPGAGMNEIASIDQSNRYHWCGWKYGDGGNVTLEATFSSSNTWQMTVVEFVR